MSRCASWKDNEWVYAICNPPDGQRQRRKACSYRAKFYRCEATRPREEINLYERVNRALSLCTIGSTAFSL